MAADQWMEIYRSYESEELDVEIAQLRKDVRGSFTAQGAGSVNHSRDLGELRDRLHAASRVKSERREDATPMRGQVSFRRNGWGQL
jgi:hypothetical protein